MKPPAEPPEDEAPATGAPPSRAGFLLAAALVVIVGLAIGAGVGLVARPGRTEIEVHTKTVSEKHPVDVTAPSCLTALDMQGRLIRLYVSMALKLDQAAQAEDREAAVRKADRELVADRKQAKSLEGKARTNREACRKAGASG